MAEPSSATSAFPHRAPRRPRWGASRVTDPVGSGRVGRPGAGGRLGLLTGLVVPVLALAALTQFQQTRSPAGAVASADPDTDAPAGPRLAFGSVTRQGAILFEVGRPTRARAVEPDGMVAWQRTLDDGDYLACGPCPTAVLVHFPPGGDAATTSSAASATVATVGASGTEGPPPPTIDPADGTRPVATTSLRGVVLAARRPDGRTEFLTATSAGLVSAGSAPDPALDRPLVVVTPAQRGGAVTIMRAAADPLRQGEFEVEHVTPAGATTDDLALDAPGSRPLPCTVVDAHDVAYLQLDPGPTADGTTHVVVRRDGAVALDAVVGGSFDGCAVGPRGAVLTSSANGADGDLTRTRVDVRWVDRTGSVAASATEQVVATSASLAVDAATGRVAVAGGTGPAVVVDADGGRTERPPARAVAVDDGGGLWWAGGDGTVSREAAP